MAFLMPYRRGKSNNKINLSGIQSSVRGKGHMQPEMQEIHDSPGGTRTSPTIVRFHCHHVDVEETLSVTKSNARNRFRLSENRWRRKLPWQELTSRH